MDIVNRVAAEAVRVRPFLPTYTHLMASTIFLLYTGAHASLTRPSSAAELQKKQKGDKDESKGDDEDDEDEIVVQKMEGLSPSDAFLFPVMAGVTLASLYFLIKWLKDPAVLNKILNYYFSLSGSLFAVRFLKDVLSVSRSLVFPSQYGDDGKRWRVTKGKQEFRATTSLELKKTSSTRNSPLPGILQKLPLSNQVIASLWSIRETLYAKANLKFHLHRIVSLHSPVDLLDAIAIAVSIPLVTYFTFFSKPWYLTNFLGFSFSYGSLQYMSPTTFSTGSLLLGALFLYDIYFVFFTPMMVTVAKKLDVPIKLLFPRPAGPGADPTVEALSMLGLGDIIIPGMMIGLALRYDLYLHYLKKQVTGNNESGGETTIVKSKYRQATGGWGERFWTPAYLQPEPLQAKTFPKPYFTAGLLGYVIGMAATLGAMQLSDHPQPALLYLVPGVLISLGGTAVARGELKEMYKFSEDVGEESRQKEEEEEEKTGDKGEKNIKEPEDMETAPTVSDSKPEADQSEDNDVSGDTEEKSHPSTSSDDSWDGLDSEHSSSGSKDQDHDPEHEPNREPKSQSPALSSSAVSVTSKTTTAKSLSQPESKSPKPKPKPRHLFHLSITLPPAPTPASDTGNDHHPPGTSPKASQEDAGEASDSAKGGEDHGHRD